MLVKKICTLLFCCGFCSFLGAKGYSNLNEVEKKSYLAELMQEIRIKLDGTNDKEAILCFDRMKKLINPYNEVDLVKDTKNASCVICGK